jgi:probable F420-dependent oxidoreductase
MSTSLAPIRISIQLQPQHGTWEKLRQAAIAADELGAHTIFNWDHFYPLAGDPDGSHFEAYTVLAAFAEVTSNARIGSLVTCNSYRNPNLLADMARTIDHISGGRFILGMGSGWAERDYLTYGYEFGTVGSRLKDLGNNLPIIRERFEKLNPGPVNGTIPIMIGGKGEKVTLRLVAQYADAWHTHGADAETLTHRLNVLHQWCEKVGRDPAEIELMTDAKIDEMDQLEGRLKIGFRHLVIRATGPDYDLGPLRELLQWRDSQTA